MAKPSVTEPPPGEFDVQADVAILVFGLQEEKLSADALATAGQRLSREKQRAFAQQALVRNRS
jgi:hypothetical protein